MLSGGGANTSSPCTPGQLSAPALTGHVGPALPYVAQNSLRDIHLESAASSRRSVDASHQLCANAFKTAIWMAVGSPPGGGRRDVHRGTALRHEPLGGAAGGVAYRAA
jgi:hypothetical protein